MSWKNNLSNPHVQKQVKTSLKKTELFNLIYTRNMENVRGKKATDVASVAKAMFDLWKESLAPAGWTSQEEVLSLYEEYLVSEGLIKSPHSA